MCPDPRSYTSFKYENLKLNASTIGPCDSLGVRVDVTNTGHVVSDEVSQTAKTCMTYIYIFVTRMTDGIATHPY